VDPVGAEEDFVTAEDRVKAVAEFGFTERQARFLVLVMRHAGVCLLRQYASFASIVHGQKTRAFFEKLVSRRYASAYPCRHNRARLYHVHHVGLYRAIGEPNSPHRRPVAAGSIRERLMVLDSMLANPELNWLATDAEKVAHFTTVTPPVPVEKLPRLTMKAKSPPVGDPFPDRLPIGIDSNGRAMFLYLVRPYTRDDLQAFLSRHAELLCSLPSWTLRLVFPRQLAHAYEAFQAVVREEWESPLHACTVEELKWYFEQRRTTPRARFRPGADERLDGAAQAFERPRFYALYRRWLRDGDRAFEAASSPLISETLARGAGRIECLVLPHRYDHLAPLVDIVESIWRGVENTEGEGNDGLPRCEPTDHPLEPECPFNLARRVREQLHADGR
jgi:hypothetical protein